MQLQLEHLLIPGKVTIIYGPRQVGKTTLVTDVLQTLPYASRLINADELVYRDILASQDLHRLAELASGVDLLVIDEAQRVPDIGINLKLLIDNHPGLILLVTGSASLELANQVSEPLTGRKITLTLYPVSYPELRDTFGTVEARTMLDRWLIWGGYPEIVTTGERTFRERLLGELTGSYLYRDLLILEDIRRADKLVDLLRLLAFQIGQEVSQTELATSLAINRQTVDRYLDLLEKAFVIYKVTGFSRNLRKEVTKNARYYFYDNGVRNSLIQNFNALHLRNDIGQLWENFLMVERKKANAHASRAVNSYFWRTYDRKEIDYIEEQQGTLNGYEFKWQGAVKESTRKAFLSAYPGAFVQTITRDNFEAFVFP